MKRTLLLSLSILMLTGICSGCSKETEKSDKNTSSSQSIENIGNNTMPSGSIGTVNGIEIEICGHKVSFPCEFKELGDEFTLENGYYFEEQDYTLYHLYYQHEDVGTIYLAGKQKDDNSNAMVVGIDTRNLKNNQFFIDGLGYDTRETYIEHFGEPDVQKENHLEYVSENIAFAVFFFDSDSEDIDFAENIVLLFTNQGRKKIHQDTANESDGDSVYTINFSEGSVTLPCLVKDLPFFEIDESSFASSFGYTVGYLSYDGMVVGRVFLDEAESDMELKERTVIGLEISCGSGYEYSNLAIDYKGITIFDTVEKLEEIFGEPDSDISTKSRHSYPLDENHPEQCVTFQIAPFNDTIEAIGLYIK